MDSIHTDPTWVKDFNEAFRNLLSGPGLYLPGGEGVLLLTAPQELRRPCVQAVPIKPPLDLRMLRGSALRSAILGRMTISKTANPYVREVRIEGRKVGKLAKSPYHLMLWLSSADRRIPFTSMIDAAVFTCAEYLGADETCADPLDPWDSGDE